MFMVLYTQTSPPLGFPSVFPLQASFPSVCLCSDTCYVSVSLKLSHNHNIEVSFFFQQTRRYHVVGRSITCPHDFHFSSLKSVYFSLSTWSHALKLDSQLFEPKFSDPSALFALKTHGILLHFAIPDYDFSVYDFSV